MSPYLISSSLESVTAIAFFAALGFLTQQKAIGGALLFLIGCVCTDCLWQIAHFGTAPYPYALYRVGSMDAFPMMMIALPNLMLSAWAIACCVSLIKIRDAKSVQKMKVVLVGVMAARIFQLVIELAFRFVLSSFASILSLIIPAAFLLYLFGSTRVKRVFATA